ncbi:MAG: hypothetical protein ACXVVK_22625 [Solirubrobacteraceae bacterium]
MPTGDTAHADPIQEGRRLVTSAAAEGVTLRLIGGVAVRLQAPPGGPLLTREIKDIDVVTPRGNNRGLAAVFTSLGYLGDELFNAMHGTHRQLWVDPLHRRQVDVFVGVFSMCHEIPIADRLDRDPLTVPLAELLLTKLQIVELNERDERDIYSLCFHHDLDAIGAGFIAELCARDWGLWRTCRQTIERCLADISDYGLAVEQQELIAARLGGLWERIEAEPKSGKWKRRSRVGDRKRWYEEPEEEREAT